MNHSQQQTPSLSFQEAILETQSLMVKMSQNELQESEIERAIATMIDTKAGARGFFVPYLTGDLTLADNPSSGVIEALKTAPEIVGELLVKNLAMSTAMAVVHQRNQDLENALGSEQVARRTANLIRQMNLDIVKTEITKLEQTIAKGEGNYQSFLKRWGYDAEQQQAIYKAIKAIEI
ncbi:hypothetical protein [Myxosarcina sp. GI1]|uniref:hypothetical protein n=1 Tax=Myxosarcina sp. GI1 TaxID=1541065 RepID=UPI000561FE0A|nr:hypothetical protein [Myxosarcina sp. GI1]